MRVFNYNLADEGILIRCIHRTNPLFPITFSTSGPRPRHNLPRWRAFMPSLMIIHHTSTSSLGSRSITDHPADLRRRGLHFCSASPFNLVPRQRTARPPSFCVRASLPPPPRCVRDSAATRYPLQSMSEPFRPGLRHLRQITTALRICGPCRAPDIVFRPLVLGDGGGGHD